MYSLQGRLVAQFFNCREQSCALRTPLLVATAAAGRHQQQLKHHHHQHRPRSAVIAPAVATETVTSTGWLRTLIPFGRKAAAEPIIPVISAQQLQIHLEQCSDTPLVIIFSAVWCGPCKVMMQRLEKVATELGPKVKVVKIDTDESEGGSELATELGIYKLPTIMFCGPQAGKPAVQVQGLVNETVLLDMMMNKSQYMGNSLHNSMKW